MLLYLQLEERETSVKTRTEAKRSRLMPRKDEGCARPFDCKLRNRARRPANQRAGTVHSRKPIQMVVIQAPFVIRSE
jgi:hypothetical protein